MSSLCVVAGDPSGDAHAARLIDAIARHEPALRLSGLGGPQMGQAGVALLDDLTRTASIGPFDALAHLKTFADVRARFAQHLANDRPEVVVFVDFGDFNLPVLAPLAKRAGCRVLYYISPQLWAWGRFRLRWVRRCVDRMIVFFRFEEQFYREAGVPVTWVGHPLSDVAPPSASREQLLQTLGLNPWRTTVGLLPGSREREISRHLPLLLKAAERIAWHMPGVQFLIPKAPNVSDRALAALAPPRAVDVVVREGRMAECLQAMDAAVVASGTATLETALAQVPMAVVYRTSWPTYLAARAVVRVPHIALVNVIAGRMVVPEFIQHRARPGHIAQAVVALLRQAPTREAMRAALQRVREQLGPPGAVERAAEVVREALRG